MKETNLLDVEKILNANLDSFSPEDFKIYDVKYSHIRDFLKKYWNAIADRAINLGSDISCFRCVPEGFMYELIQERFEKNFDIDEKEYIKKVNELLEFLKDFESKNSKSFKFKKDDPWIRVYIHKGHSGSKRIMRIHIDAKYEGACSIFLAIVLLCFREKLKLSLKLRDSYSSSSFPRFDEIIIYFNEDSQETLKKILLYVHNEFKDHFNNDKFFLYGKTNLNGIFCADEYYAPNRELDSSFKIFGEKAFPNPLSSAGDSYTEVRATVMLIIIRKIIELYYKSKGFDVSKRLSFGNLNSNPDKQEEFRNIPNDHNFDNFIKEAVFYVCPHMNVNPEAFQKNIENIDGSKLSYAPISSTTPSTFSPSPTATRHSTQRWLSPRVIVPKKTPMPEGFKIDLSPGFSKIRDQGDLQSCVAFAYAFVIEYLINRVEGYYEEDKKVLVSPLYLYWFGRVDFYYPCTREQMYLKTFPKGMRELFFCPHHDNKKCHDRGSDPPNYAHGLAEGGFVYEEDYKYDDKKRPIPGFEELRRDIDGDTVHWPAHYEGKFAEKPPESLIKKGKLLYDKYIKEVVRVDGVENWIEVLKQGYPVIVSIRNNIHRVVLVGYNSTTKEFKIKDSFRTPVKYGKDVSYWKDQEKEGYVVIPKAKFKHHDSMPDGEFKESETEELKPSEPPISPTATEGIIKGRIIYEPITLSKITENPDKKTGKDINNIVSLNFNKSFDVYLLDDNKKEIKKATSNNDGEFKFDALELNKKYYVAIKIDGKFIKHTDNKLGRGGQFGDDPHPAKIIELTPTNPEDKNVIISFNTKGSISGRIIHNAATLSMIKKKPEEYSGKELCDDASKEIIGYSKAKVALLYENKKIEIICDENGKFKFDDVPLYTECLIETNDIEGEVSTDRVPFGRAGNYSKDKENKYPGKSVITLDIDNREEKYVVLDIHLKKYIYVWWQFDNENEFREVFKKHIRPGELTKGTQLTPVWETDSKESISNTQSTIADKKLKVISLGCAKSDNPEKWKWDSEQRRERIKAGKPDVKDSEYEFSI